MAVPSKNAKNDKLLFLKEKQWNDFAPKTAKCRSTFYAIKSTPYKNTVPTWNAERSTGTIWNGVLVSTLKTLNKTWNDCRSVPKNITYPFTNPRLFRAGGEV